MISLVLKIDLTEEQNKKLECLIDAIRLHDADKTDELLDSLKEGLTKEEYEQVIGVALSPLETHHLYWFCKKFIHLFRRETLNA